MATRITPNRLDRCPVCQNGDVMQLVEVENLPVHCHLLFDDPRAARAAARGDLRLAICLDCGHAFNQRFDPELMEYEGAYENSLHGSPTFQHYAESLAQRLVEQYGIRGQRVLEIGCGRGEFLELLCRQGSNRGIGFDPSYRPSLETRKVETPKYEIIADYYGEAYASHTAELVCCRHVLEHLSQPEQLVRTARRALAGATSGVAAFEVPNLRFTLRDMGIWDLIYEHCSYFSRESLGYLFERCGFRPHRIEEAYAGQFLAIEASPASVQFEEPARPPLDDLLALASQFAVSHAEIMGYWRRKLAELRDLGRRAAIWGAGSKTVTFLNALAAGDEVVEVVVDVNPRKHGKYVVGTGHAIVAPAALRNNPPEVVIIMNPIYREEISDALRQLGCDTEVLCAADVSDHVVTDV